MYTGLWVIVLLGGPWDDPSGRYALDLPNGWRHVRSESHSGKPVFTISKRRHGSLSASIQLEPVPDAIGLPGVHKRRLDAIRATGAASLLHDEPARIDGYRARSLLYNAPHPDTNAPETVREVFTQIFNLAYIMTFRGDRGHFDAFEEEIDGFVDSLVPRNPKSELKEGATGPSPLIGRWVRTQGPKSVLVLGADGSLQMDKESGSYAVTKDTIVTLLKNGGQRSYKWNTQGPKLVLRSDEGRAVYRRIRD